MKYISKAFTLVELIVVITILSILGTIGFVSLQGYSTSARESSRASDLNVIARALEYYKIEEGSYPTPSSDIEISYSGSLAWRQGTYGEDTRIITGRISQVPVDPLTGNEYAYATTNTRQEYELGAISESPLAQMGDTTPSLIPTNSAHANNRFFTRVKGNYNKKILTVTQADRLFILGVPTLLTTEIVDVTVEDILANQSFSVRNSQNLPASYADSLGEGETHTGDTSFTPGTTTLGGALLYEGSSDDLSTAQAKNDFGSNIVNYYRGSNISSDPGYVDIPEVGSQQEIAFVNTLIASDVGGLVSREIALSDVPENSPILGGDDPLEQSTTCYDPINVNTIGTEGICTGMLIVDNTLIRNGLNVDGSYSVTGPDGTPYTFGNSRNNIFTGQVTSLTTLFVNDTDFNEDIGYWDVSNVTSMSGLFQGASAFNQDIGGWDTSNVTNMHGIFSNASAFNGDISGWDTSNVTNMNFMFQRSAVFNGDISGWDTSNVTSMLGMFNQSAVFNGDISGWDTSSVTSMQNMFNQSAVFNGDISGWDTSSVTNMQLMFFNTDAFNRDISGWDTSSVTNMDRMFNGADIFNQDLSSWCVDNIASEPSRFSTSTPAWDPKVGRQPVWGTCP